MVDGNFESKDFLRFYHTGARTAKDGFKLGPYVAELEETFNLPDNPAQAIFLARRRFFEKNRGLIEELSQDDTKNNASRIKSIKRLNNDFRRVFLSLKSSIDSNSNDELKNILLNKLLLAKKLGLIYFKFNQKEQNDESPYIIDGQIRFSENEIFSNLNKVIGPLAFQVYIDSEKHNIDLRLSFKPSFEGSNFITFETNEQQTRLKVKNLLEPEKMIAKYFKVLPNYAIGELISLNSCPNTQLPPNTLLQMGLHLPNSYLTAQQKIDAKKTLALTDTIPRIKKIIEHYPKVQPEFKSIVNKIFFQLVNDLIKLAPQDLFSREENGLFLELDDIKLYIKPGEGSPSNNNEVYITNKELPANSNNTLRIKNYISAPLLQLAVDQTLQRNL